MPALALDIGTYTIKAIHASPGEQPVLERVVEVFNAYGIAVPTDDASEEKLKNSIQSVIADNNFPTNDVRLSLPETVVSTKVIDVPPLTDAELASAIGWQAERHIPIPPEELSLEYQVLRRPKKNEQAPMKVLLVGVRKPIVERYVSIFTSFGVEPSLVETQMLSIMRSLQFTANDPTTLIAHFGASSLVMAVVDHQELQFVVTQMSGSQILTKTLQTVASLEASQAEQYKRNFGLDSTQLEGKVRAALIPQVNDFVEHMLKAIQYFASEKPQSSVKRVVLSGGASLLPGFVQYVTSKLNVEVLMAAPFTTAKGQVPENINHPSMSVAMGLLMRKDL